MTNSQNERGGDSYQVGVAINSPVGHQPLAVNITGGNEQAIQALTRVLAEQRHTLPPEQVSRLEAQLRQMRAEMGQGFADARAGQGALSAQMESAIGGLQATLLARLESQEAHLTDEILAVLESGAVAADELDRHLAVIQRAVQQSRSTQPAAQTALAQAQEILAAPGLDVRSKLKVAVPLIPFLLTYEGEVELGQRVNVEEALAAVWRAMTAWVRGAKEPGL